MTSSRKQSEPDPYPLSRANREKSSATSSDTEVFKVAVCLPSSADDVGRAKEEVSLMSMPVPVWAAVKVRESIERSRRMARDEFVRRAGGC